MRYCIHSNLQLLYLFGLFFLCVQNFKKTASKTNVMHIVVFSAPNLILKLEIVRYIHNVRNRFREIAQTLRSRISFSFGFGLKSNINCSRSLYFVLNLLLFLWLHQLFYIVGHTCDCFSHTFYIVLESRENKSVYKTS